MAESLHWGILGTGNIARQFAAGVLSSRRGTIAAVGSRTLSAATRFAQTFQIAESFGNYQDVLTSKSVDVVYVALPNSMHHEWTLAALRAGKHVLCEKPIASNAAEAREMFDVADKAGKLLIEAFMYRSHPLTLAVVDAVRSGTIGELKLIRTSFCFRTRKIDGNIRFSRELSGGALMDVGCYCINFSRFFAGAEPIRFDVAGNIHENGVDDLAVGTLAFANGVIASFTCGMGVQAVNTASLCGSEGYIEIPVPWKPPGQGAEFTIGQSTPPKMDSAGASTPVIPPPQKRVVNAGMDLYAVEADDIAAILLDGRPPRITRQDSIGNMLVLDAMRRQLKIL